VPHLPAIEMGFNHAGHEVWYEDNTNVDLFKICLNKSDQEESWDCSDSYYFYDPGAHLDYLGLDVVGQCKNYGDNIPKREVPK
jgi:hypothetical protein